MEARAWLLERSGTEGPEWAFFDGFGLCWTRDSLKAIHFSRREDAEQIVSICESEDVKATEHEWGERESAAPAPVTATITIDANILAGQMILILDGEGPWEEREEAMRSMLKACAAAPARAETARNTADDYVAWVRYTEYSIVTCDSDAPGAFKVYRHPRQVPEETVSSPAHQEWLRERKSQDPLNPQPIAQPASRETVAETHCVHNMPLECNCNKCAEECAEETVAEPDGSAMDFARSVMRRMPVWTGFETTRWLADEIVARDAQLVAEIKALEISRDQLYAQGKADRAELIKLQDSLPELVAKTREEIAGDLVDIARDFYRENFYEQGKRIQAYAEALAAHPEKQAQREQVVEGRGK